MVKPLISICMPAYNAEKYISETLNCLLSQDYLNLEIVIVNDQSTDETKNRLVNFASKDSRLIVEDSVKKGAAAARNQAFKTSKGELIVFFDADDIVPLNFLTSQVKNYLDCEEKTVVYSDIGRFYNNDPSTFKVDNKQDLGNYNFSEWISLITKHGSGLNVPGRYLIPRIVIEEKNPWDESLTLNDDFPFFAKVFRSANEVRINKDVALFYRTGHSSLSNTRTSSAIQSLWESLNITAEIILKDNRTKEGLKCCATLYKNFIYDVYPNEQLLLDKASFKIKELGGLDYTRKFAGATGILSQIIGWKATKKLKTLLRK